MAKRSYSTEFKIQALELVKQTGSLSSAAKQLGINENVLYNWKKKFNFDPSSKSKSASEAVAETEEVKRLKKQVLDLEKSNYILKRAAAFFSQDLLK